ncbi:GTP cyclohydrolase II [Paragemmobacter ruber]|nr:GTP cyclohydrolase II [Rhodobacter ruber]
MRARCDLRLGLPVVLQGPGQGSTAPGVLVLAVEGLSEARHRAALQTGGAELVLTGARATALGLEAGGAATVRLSARGLSHAQVLQLADPLREAGMAAPRALAMKEGGAVQAAGIALVKAAQLLPALFCVPMADAKTVALDQGLTVLTVEEVQAETALLSPHLPVSAAALPMAVSAAGRVHVFRPEDGGQEHYAIEVGTVRRDAPVLVRLHSACFTGDVLGSLKCDCGPQLQAAMAAMAEAGGGVLLYLNQEGRGIGLANKMRAYALQERGLDTVEANHHLGFEDDERDFRIGAALLSRLGIGKVRLMTNNPAKVAMLDAHGLHVVERVPLVVGRTAQNAGYLATKARKSGHLLP